LDNFGLFAALRWQIKKTWGDSDVVSTENYPDVEPRFESRAATTLFRIAQEALSMILASIRYRIRALGGNVQTSRTEARSTVLTVSMPLREVVAG
jgi:signal transduction histidine kinase